MANRLKMDKVQAILALHARGWPQRKIARELGIHRTTVAAHLPKPTKVPIGSEAGAVPGGRATSEALEPSRSECEPYRDQIQEMLDQGFPPSASFVSFR